MEFKIAIPTAARPCARADGSYAEALRAKRRAFFAKGQPPQRSSGPKHGVDEPGGDKDRLTAAALNLLSSAVPLFNPADPIRSITSLAENNCRSLVDNHFMIFADVQELVRARHANE